jgi:general secretion pathway protein B
MSFILDALKKSESDRQRQSGPALFEVKVTPPKPRFPYWALALAALLVINIAVAAWVFLHRAPPEETAAVESLPTQSRAQEREPAAATASPPSQSVAPVTAAPTTAASAPPASAVAATSSPPEPVLSDSEPKDAALNPDDYEPAVTPAKQYPDQAGARVKSGTESGLKSYSDAAQSPDSRLPALRIDLHVYAAKPQDRFVLINMHRLHEGDTLPEGVRVESITPEGVVVSYRGSKYILEHE